MIVTVVSSLILSPQILTDLKFYKLGVVFSFSNELKHLHGRLAYGRAHQLLCNIPDKPPDWPPSLLLTMLLSPTKEYSENSKGIIQLRYELDCCYLLKKLPGAQCCKKGNSKPTMSHNVQELSLCRGIR